MRGKPRSQTPGKDIDRLKLHRRVLRLDGRDHTIVTPRPGTDVRFSTNYYHETWHILTDWRGAAFLSRLLWGLAYQRVPGTLVLIDRPFLDPNPFDGAPADPIALVPSQLTHLTWAAAQQLRRLTPLRGHSDGTVRWQTHGLDRAVADRRAEWNDPTPGRWRAPWIPPKDTEERVARIGGLVTLSAIPKALRRLAPAVATVGDFSYYGSNDLEIDWPNGEVQIFDDYRRRVSSATVARREILAENRDGSDDPEQLRRAIWNRGTDARARQPLRRRDRDRRQNTDVERRNVIRRVPSRASSSVSTS